MLVSFAIVFFILVKFGFPIITRMVDKRQDGIDRALEEAMEAKAIIANLKTQGDQIINTAREQSQDILNTASQIRSRMLEQARLDARQEGEKLLDQTRRQVERERKTALQDIRTEVARLSVDVAEKILRHELDSSDKQMQLVSRLIDETVAEKKQENRE